MIIHALHEVSILTIMYLNIRNNIIFFFFLSTKFHYIESIRQLHLVSDFYNKRESSFKTLEIAQMEKHPESARATVLFNATSLRHASFMRWAANLAAPPNQTTTCFPKTPLVLYLSSVNIHRKQQRCFIQRTLTPNMKAFYFPPRNYVSREPFNHRS